MFKKFLNSAYPFPMSPEDQGGSSGGQGGQQQEQGGGTTGSESADKSGGEGEKGNENKGQGTGSEGDKGQPKLGADGKPLPVDGDGAAQEESDWRKDMADDEKDLERLNRFTSKKELWKALKEAQAKISSHKPPLSKDATPEQTAAWRKNNGIPEKPDGYIEKLPDGLVFGEQDKAALEPFLKDMHDKNVAPEVVQSTLASYQRAIEMQNQRIQEQDSQIVAATEDELRKEWQGDFRANMTAADAFLTSHFPAEAKAALMNARDGEGKPIMHNAGFLRAAAQLGRTLAPAGATFGNGIDSISSIDTELASLKGQMGTKAWFKDEAKQARYRELLNAKERFKKTA